MSEDKRAGAGATHFGFETVDEQKLAFGKAMIERM